MSLDLTTPALLFPAISLLLLAYTNRFLTIANLIRSLNKKYDEDPGNIIYGQIKNLRRRIYLIKYMQVWGVGSLFLCVASMFALFLDYDLTGAIIFGISLIMLMISLWQSIHEIMISTEALNIELTNMER